jgi:ABC-type transporter Mla MlaB component
MSFHALPGPTTDMRKFVPVDLVLGETARADLATVDELARLQLAAKRSGCQIRLIDVPERLRALLDLAGLRDALGLEP